MTSRIWGLTSNTHSMLTTAIIMVKDDAQNRSVIPDDPTYGIIYSLFNMCSKMELHVMETIIKWKQ